MGRKKDLFSSWSNHGDGTTVRWFKNLLKQSKATGRSVLLKNPEQKFSNWLKTNGYSAESNAHLESAGKILSDFGFEYSKDKKGYILRIDRVLMTKIIAREHETNVAAAEAVVLAMGETKKEANRVIREETKDIDVNIERLKKKISNLKGQLRELKKDNERVNRELGEFKRGVERLPRRQMLALPPIPEKGIEESRITELEESVEEAEDMSESIDKDVEELPGKLNEEVNLEDVDKVERSIEVTPRQNLLKEIEKGKKLKPVERRERTSPGRGEEGIKMSLEKSIIDAIKKRRKSIGPTEESATSKNNAPSEAPRSVSLLHRREWHSTVALKAVRRFEEYFDPGEPDSMRKGEIVWHNNKVMKRVGGMQMVSIRDRDEQCCTVYARWESAYTKEVSVKAYRIVGENFGFDYERGIIYTHGMTVREAICRMYYLKMVFDNGMSVEAARLQCEKRVTQLEEEYHRKKKRGIRLYKDDKGTFVMVLSKLNSERCGGKSKKGKKGKKDKRSRLSRVEAKSILKSGKIDGRDITPEEREKLKTIAYRR